MMSQSAAERQQQPTPAPAAFYPKMMVHYQQAAAVRRAPKWLPLPNLENCIGH